MAGGNTIIKNEEEYLRGSYIAQPKMRRDNKERAAFCPPNFVPRENREKITTLKDIQE